MTGGREGDQWRSTRGLTGVRRIQAHTGRDLVGDLGATPRRRLGKAPDLSATRGSRWHEIRAGRGPRLRGVGVRNIKFFWKHGCQVVFWRIRGIVHFSRASNARYGNVE
jgi:hypothetical protein